MSRKPIIPTRPVVPVVSNGSRPVIPTRQGTQQVNGGRRKPIIPTAPVVPAVEQQPEVQKKGNKERSNSKEREGGSSVSPPPGEKLSTMLDTLKQHGIVMDQNDINNVLGIEANTFCNDAVNQMKKMFFLCKCGVEKDTEKEVIQKEVDEIFKFIREFISMFNDLVGFYRINNGLAMELIKKEQELFVKSILVFTSGLVFNYTYLEHFKIWKNTNPFINLKINEYNPDLTPLITEQCMKAKKNNMKYVFVISDGNLSSNKYLPYNVVDHKLISSTKEPFAICNISPENMVKVINESKKNGKDIVLQALFVIDIQERTLLMDYVYDYIMNKQQVENRIVSVNCCTASLLSKCNVPTIEHKVEYIYEVKETKRNMYDTTQLPQSLSNEVTSRINSNNKITIVVNVNNEEEANQIKEDIKKNTAIVFHEYTNAKKSFGNAKGKKNVALIEVSSNTRLIRYNEGIIVFIVKGGEEMNYNGNINAVIDCGYFVRSVSDKDGFVEKETKLTEEMKKQRMYSLGMKCKGEYVFFNISSIESVNNEEANRLENVEKSVLEAINLNINVNEMKYLSSLYEGNEIKRIIQELIQKGFVTPGMLLTQKGVLYYNTLEISREFSEIIAECRDNFEIVLYTEISLIMKNTNLVNNCYSDEMNNKFNPKSDIDTIVKTLTPLFEFELDEASEKAEKMGFNKKNIHESLQQSG